MIPKPEEVQFLIGPYQVLKRIGQGGIGEVFLVYDPIYHRKIALKRLRSDIQADEQKRQQFLNEARITSQLTHPYIINIFTIAEEKDQVYYTMPFIEGATLKEILSLARQRARENLSLRDDISVAALSHHFLKICQAVAFAYSKRVIHRDLKPSNIIIGMFGELRILDWGLAMPVKTIKGPAEIVPMNKEVAGTVIYLAPELTFGEPPSLQSEIYALGVILYEMLTLRYPFHRENLQEYVQNMQTEVLLDPAKVASSRNIPPVLSRMALKCLAYAPEERYQNVEEIIHELECYLQIPSTSIKTEDTQTYEPSVRERPEETPILKSPASHRLLLDRAKESSAKDRKIFYRDALIALCDRPINATSSDLENLCSMLKNQLEPLYFIDWAELSTWPEPVQQRSLAVHLAFLLAQPQSIDQILVSALKLYPSPISSSRRSWRSLN